MAKRGRMVYIPRSMLDTKIKIENFTGMTGSKALNEMANYAEFGLEFDKSFGWLYPRKKKK